MKLYEPGKYSKNYSLHNFSKEYATTIINPEKIITVSVLQAGKYAAENSVYSYPAAIRQLIV